jgi:hypothetical protein
LATKEFIFKCTEFEAVLEKEGVDGVEQKEIKHPIIQSVDWEIICI